MALEKHIRQLLFEHDCVIIPDFGGFLTRFEPAHIHRLQGVVIPPSKVVQFNRRLHANDGLLAHAVMRHSGVSYAAAVEYIREAVDALEALLASESRAELPSIGVIFLDDQGNYRFNPSDETNFLKSSFGLGAVYLPVSADNVGESAAESGHLAPVPAIPIATESSVGNARQAAVPSESPKRRWAIAAVLIPAVAVGAFLLKDRIPAAMDTFNLRPSSPAVHADFQPRFVEEDVQFEYEPFRDRIAEIEASNPALSSVTFDFTENEIAPEGIRVVLKNETPVSNAQPGNDSDTKSVDLDAREAHRYFVVGGAFSDPNNASRLVSELVESGYDAYMFGKSGALHMVCYGGFSAEEEAQALLSSVRNSTNPQAWLKRQ